MSIKWEDVEVGDFVKATFGDVFVTPDWVEVSFSKLGGKRIGGADLGAFLLTITDHKPSEARLRTEKKKAIQEARDKVEAAKKALEAAYAELDGEDLVDSRVVINYGDYKGCEGVVSSFRSHRNNYFITLDNETIRRYYRDEFDVIVT